MIGSFGGPGRYDSHAQLVPYSLSSWIVSDVKEVVGMMFQLVFNWKTFAAIGGSLVAVILARKLTSDQSERVLTSMVGAARYVSGADD